MTNNILITGGAGFIGSHLADELLMRGHRVRVLDNLKPQVHGKKAARPAYLSREVELVAGDVRDRATVMRCLDGIDAVYHLAAAVGVGQSMYEIERYVSTNDQGTAVLDAARAADRLLEVDFVCWPHTCHLSCGFKGALQRTAAKGRDRRTRKPSCQRLRRQPPRRRQADAGKPSGQGIGRRSRRGVTDKEQRAHITYNTVE